jgi:hypothetical protein
LDSLFKHSLDILGKEEPVDVTEHFELDSTPAMVLHRPPHFGYYEEDPHVHLRGDKDVSNKTDVSAVPAFVEALLGRIYEYGAKKYNRGSWRKGFPDSEIASAMERHYLLWRAGEKDDKESGEPHLGHLAWGALTLYMQEALGTGTRDLDRDPKEADLVRDLLYGRPVTATKFSKPK